MAEKELLRLVYRNRGSGRKDAAYVIRVLRSTINGVERDSLFGLYGPWQTYEERGSDALRGQWTPKHVFDAFYPQLGVGSMLAYEINQMHLERRRKGYALVPEESRGAGAWAKFIVSQYVSGTVGNIPEPNDDLLGDQTPSDPTNENPLDVSQAATITIAPVTRASAIEF